MFRLNEDRPEFGLEAGDYVASCPTTGIFYAPPLTAGVLGYLLFPDDYAEVPPG